MFMPSGVVAATASGDYVFDLTAGASGSFRGWNRPSLGAINPDELFNDFEVDRIRGTLPSVTAMSIQLNGTPEPTDDDSSWRQLVMNGVFADSTGEVILLRSAADSFTPGSTATWEVFSQMTRGNLVGTEIYACVFS